MKRWFSLCAILMLVCLQGHTQQFLNVYQDNVVIRQISTSEIDSISFTETEPHIISMWNNGNVCLTYTSEDIDSITVTSQGGAPFSYIGIVGFNDQLYMKDIGILSNSTAGDYRSFVSSLSRRDGTLLYYAVDNALDMLDKAIIKTPLKNVSLITFTDGLDLGSLMMTDKYDSSYEYLDAMSKRIASTKVNGIPVNAYSVGLRGNDVTNVPLFQQNLRDLSSTEENSFELSNISGLREKLKAIADQIISVSNRQTISLRIPGTDGGTRECFTFDGKPAGSSQLYIEGTFNRKDLSLHDVTYHGLKATSGTVVQGTQDGIFVTYTFMGMRLESGSGLIPTSNIQHYYMLPSANSWQKNTEFGSTKDTQTSISHSGATIFLILDCSSSLGSDFSWMQQYSNEFIDLIAANAEPFSMLAPTNVKAIMDEKNWGVNVSWDAVKYAEYYSVYRSSSSYSGFTKVADSLTVTKWRDEIPLQGSNYYRIYAMGHGLTSLASSTSGGVKCEIETPKNVTVTMDEKDWGVIVSWDAVKYAQSYNVYRSSSSSGTYKLVAENVATTTWTDNNPLSGNNYYKVSAIGYGMSSFQSSYVYVNVKIDAPMNVTAVMDEKDWAVNVSWDAVKYAQSYNVYRNISSSGTYKLVAENVTTTTWTDNNPLSGNNYYKVSALCYGLSSFQSSYAYVNVKIDAPMNVTAVMDEKDWAVNVSWDVVKYAEYYSVYRSSSSISGFTKVADSLTVNNWRDETPLQGSNYYRIYAMGHGLTTSASSTSSVVNCEMTCPTNVTASMDGNEIVVNVSWDAVKYAEYYSVYRSCSSTSGFTVIADSLKLTSWRDEFPLNGNNYYCVYAKGHGLTSSASETSNLVEVIRPLCPDNHHPHLIDLGLPSGTKWACCNVDDDHSKQSPTNYGSYYAWGETKRKDYYDWSNYTHCNGSSDTCYDLGSDIAGIQYDVAHVQWIGSWMMPSREQQDELLAQCTYTWTTINGINGGQFTGPSGYSIFLPAAGYRWGDGFYNVGKNGCYWSSTRNPSFSFYVYGLDFFSDDVQSKSYFRNYGYPVRPVSK